MASKEYVSDSCSSISVAKLFLELCSTLEIPRWGAKGLEQTFEATRPSCCTSRETIFLDLRDTLLRRNRPARVKRTECGLAVRCHCKDVLVAMIFWNFLDNTPDHEVIEKHRQITKQMSLPSVEWDAM